MKLLFIPLLVVLCVVCAGCTASETSHPAAAEVSTNLTGSWVGSLQGYSEGTGYYDSNNTLTLQVTGQQGRIFNGTMSIVEADGSTTTRSIAGVIGSDKKSFTVVQSDTGYDFGTIVSDNEIELVYVTDKEPATVVIDSFKRSS